MSVLTRQNVPCRWWEIALRAAVAVAVLAGVDRLAAPLLQTPGPAFDRPYRLPADDPLSEADDYVAHIRAVQPADGRVRVAFLGASQTYGYAVEDAAETVPYAFARAAEAGGGTAERRVTAYSLSANGFKLADEYFLLRAVLDDVDVVFVQLAYQTFGPDPDARRMREPELPRTLGLRVSAEEAEDTGAPASPALDLGGSLAGALSRRWLLLRERDTACQLLLGGRPRRVLAAAIAPLGFADPASEDAPETVSMASSDPAEQFVTVGRFADATDFRVKAADAEMVMLRRICELLSRSGKKAVFYLSPMNEDALKLYGVLDERAYRANAAAIRLCVERAGFPLLDYHAQPCVPGERFVDMTHTDASGCSVLAQRLLADSEEYLGWKTGSQGEGRMESVAAPRAGGE